MDRKIIILNEVDSTNNYAKQLVADKVDEGTVVLAHYQRNGKGQQGNFWESEAHKNLLFSMILYPDNIEAANQFIISKVVSLALINVLKTKLNKVSIKWPNDIYVGGNKISGILIENSINGVYLDSSVIGVGLNINQEIFKSNTPNPISLKQLTGEHLDVYDILNEFIRSFYLIWDNVNSGVKSNVHESYLANLFRKNKWSLYRANGDEFEARIIGVGDFGQLQLEDKSGSISEYMFKEVEFVF